MSENSQQDEIVYEGIKYPTDIERYTKLEQSEIRSRIFYNNVSGVLMGAVAVLAIVAAFVLFGNYWHKSATPMGESKPTNVAPTVNYDELPYSEIPYYQPQTSDEPMDVIAFRAPQLATNTGTQISGYSRGCTAPNGRYLVYVEGLTANGSYRVQTDINRNGQYRTSTPGNADHNGNATFAWSCYTATGMPMSDGIYTVLVTDDNTGNAATVQLTISMDPNN